ncbi:MAG: hypothetical protein QXU44_04730 [Candidatus Caldarchaeum sp.]
MSVQIVKLNIIARIISNDLPDGFMMLPVSNVVCTWGLNSIPTCQLTCPLGRDVKMSNSIDGLSTGFLVTSGFLYEQYLEVYLEIDQHAMGANVWPPLPNNIGILIFSGRVASYSMKQTKQAIELTLTAVSWLSDLDFSSPFSSIVHPTTPADFLFPATFSIPGGSNTGADPSNNPGAVGPTNVSIARPYFDAQVIANDMWAFDDSKKGIKGFLFDVARHGRFNWVQLMSFIKSPVRATNLDLIGALARFEPFPGENYYWGTPIKLERPSPYLANAISNAMSEIKADTLLGHTMWDILINLICREFMLAVVPMVERALIVPFAPFIDRPYRIIYPDQIFGIDMPFSLPRKIRGVAIIAPKSSFTGVTPAPATGDQRMSVAGYYESGEIGMIITAPAPKWASRTWPGSYTTYTSRTFGGRPESGDPSVIPSLEAAARQIANEESLDLKGFCNRYARSRYLTEITRGNGMLVSGPIRLDIAPGSIVSVVIPVEEGVRRLLLRDPSIPFPDILDGYFTGMVTRVTLNISRPNKIGTTTFEIGFIRNKVQSGSRDFTDVLHPIWNTDWNGAPLINWGKPDRGLPQGGGGGIIAS